MLPPLNIKFEPYAVSPPWQWHATEGDVILTPAFKPAMGDVTLNPATAYIVR